MSLTERSGGCCELCKNSENLAPFLIPPKTTEELDNLVLLCQTCLDQINDPQLMDKHHWHCLTDSMWTPVPAVQVMSWRLLNRLSSESWAQNALDSLYLEEDVLAWAKDNDNNESSIQHFDSNGVLLAAGDNVTLIKDLNVKGAGFTAKRGTAVRGISLVHDNPEHIEGRINGQKIVILCQYVKKLK